MKYLVRVTVVNFLGLLLDENRLKDKPLSSLVEIFSTYEKMFKGNLVPRIGESFPILRDSHDHYWRVAKVVDVAHESSNFDEEDKRMPVIILEDQYVGVNIPRDTTKTVPYCESWKENMATSILTNVECNALTLKNWRYCRMHGPSPHRLAPNFAVTRATGVLD